ncbi:hypothetical protein [Pseudoalteromonas viridis]|uniref:Uncharacterized protein n=1 Tax=Pseudoalteromonas viridis TaxID=339617 RepID=A0ABX7V8Z9_9GAMM|nr:hypothetical protein [Pseudoalteromonas viridis]QTL37374.1 hypothetical protein J5X90_21235 [Pseudoalteromonas viridis]
MKVVCKVNNLNSLSEENVINRLKKYISMPEGEVDLDVGKEYTVYGVVFWDSSPWYYICVEEYDEYPKPYPAEFFSVSDERLSSYWRLSVIAQEERETLSSLVFNEWAKDLSFYERLIEGDFEASEQFNKYRQLMNKE